MAAFQEDRMKISIELHIVGDGRRFLNYWDYKNGNDVIVEIRSGKLFRKRTEVSVEKFIERVVKVAKL